MKPHRLTLPLLAAACAPASAQLVIHPVYDSSITSDPNAPQIEAAFAYAAAQFEAVYTNPITINILVSKAPSGSGFLGDAESNFLPDLYSYDQVKAMLSATRLSVDDDTLIANMGPDPTGGAGFLILYSEAKLFGLRPPSDPGIDAYYYIGSDYNWTYDPNNRAVPGEFDFIGVSFHEISHCMGRWFFLDPSGYAIMDAFRYNAPGVHSLSPSDPLAYFSIDGGQTNLRYFSNSSDLCDWDGAINDSFNAYVGAGTLLPLTETDLRTMDVLGYDRVPACYANCDNSTTSPVLNVADFTCFLQKFAQGHRYANCDNSTTTPTLNVADFTCFLQKFAQGCP
jgi:serralysin